MQCPNCKHDNEDGVRFCEECGFEMANAARMTDTPTLPPESTRPPVASAEPPKLVREQIAPYTGPHLILGATGSVFKLGDLTMIGREDPSLQIDFDGYADGKYISHRHAQITRVNDTFYLEDLDSSNHTWVNGLKLSKGQSEPLHTGDTIRFGKIELTFHQ